MFSYFRHLHKSSVDRDSNSGVNLNRDKNLGVNLDRDKNSGVNLDKDKSPGVNSDRDSNSDVNFVDAALYVTPDLKEKVQKSQTFLPTLAVCIGTTSDKIMVLDIRTTAEKGPGS